MTRATKTAYEDALVFTGDALHETAHALVLHLQSHRRAALVYVTVEPASIDGVKSGGETCRGSFKSKAAVSERTALKWAEQDVAMLMAGGVAQKLIGMTRAEVRGGASHDWETIRSDVNLLRDQGLPVGLGLLLRARRNVQKLLEANWVAIGWLAAALTIRGTLTGEEFALVADTVEAHLPGEDEEG